MGLGNLEPLSPVWNWSVSVLWQPSLGVPIPPRWYPRGVRVFARWIGKRLVFRVRVDLGLMVQKDFVHESIQLSVKFLLDFSE